MSLTRWCSIRSATYPRIASSGSHPHVFLTRRRGYADRPQTSPTRYEPEPDPTGSAENVQNEFVGHTLFAFNNLKKVLVYAGYGTLILGAVTATTFEGAHFWIERQMRAVPDEDAQRWEWEVEGWTGGDVGGTSPALGFFGRHAVRAAWFSLRYGTRLGGPAAIAQAGGHRESGNLNVVESDLESARVYLETALLRVRDADGRVRADRVGWELLERHASVLERIGTRAALAKAREEYREVFRGRTGQRLAEARLAVKLGDLSERLGDGEGALSWWTRGIDLIKDDAPATSPEVTSVPSFAELSTVPAGRKTVASRVLRRATRNHPTNDDASTRASDSSSLRFPTRPPSSPAAQRTLAAAMLSLSAHYSKRRQLLEAKHVQEYAIPLIEAMVPTPEASSPVTVAPLAQSPGQTLHHMYLLHRKSVLAIHHGEVTFALASSSVLAGSAPIMGPLTDLLTAASSSEIVAQVLTGQPLSHPDMPSSYRRTEAKLTGTVTAKDGQKVAHPPSSNTPLLHVFGTSRVLRAPGASILRDARLTAAEAWDLCGVLYSEWESEGADVKALECFERALGWVGDPGDGESREGMGVNAWRSLWERYVEAREKVMKKRGR